MRIILISYLLSTWYGSGSIAFAQGLPSLGLVAHYNFNRDMTKDSSRIYDVSGNRNYGTVMGTVNYSTDRFGVPCSALAFDGQSYVTVPSSRSLKKPQDALSIAVWFRLATGADFFKQWITICCKSDQSGESPENPQYRMQATAQTVSINTEFTERIIPQLKYEVWYFYCYTFDGDKVRAYLDGRNFFEMDYSSTLKTNDMPLEIGHDLPGAEEFFFGSMDDLRIFDRALSNAEIDQLYNDRSEANSPDRCQLPPSPPVVLSPNPNQPASSTIDSTHINHQSPLLPDPTTSSSSTSTSHKQPRDTVIVKDTVFVNVSPSPQKPPKSPPKDSALLATEAYEDLPPKIGNIPIEYQKKVIVKNSEVTIYPYDHDKEDGDIVSINVNGVWVRDKYELKNKKTNPSEFLFIKCSLNPGGNNYFVSRAWNEGTMKPNTLTIEIDDGKSVQKVSINSKVGLSGGIRIACDQ